MDKLDGYSLNQIFEDVKHQIPKITKKLISGKINRKSLLEKFGKDAFLLPKKLKFPVINPQTGKYDCKLLYAAYVRARQYSDKIPEYVDIANKAKKLLEQNKCSMNIAIEGITESIDLSFLLEHVIISNNTTL